MKKNLLAILGCLSLSAAFAQTDLPRVEVFEAQGEIRELIPGSNVQGVSYNGEWAVGFGTEYSQYSFIWNRTTGEYSLITGSFLDLAYTYGVSNDGTAVGAFYKDVAGRNDSLGGCMIPGVWKNGVWTELQMEGGAAYTPIEGLEASVNGEACFISGDGAVITGYIQSNSFKRSFYDEAGTLIETRNVSLMRPAVWTKSANGTYKLERKSSALPNGDELQQGIWSRYGSSQDGSVISVVADHPTGSRSPAVVISGELIRIYGKEDIDIWSEETQYFYDGVSVTVSPNGKYVPGYWSATGSASDLKAFVYDTELGTTEEIEGWAAATVALNDGSLFGFDGYMGNALYRNADKSFNGTLDEYLRLYYGGYKGNLPQTVLSASGDGKTIGGWYAEADAIGAVSYPSIVVLNGEPDAEPDHVAELNNDRRTIIVLGDEVIAPMAVKVELYSAQGTLLGTAAADRIALDGAAQGIVVAKATYADGKVEIKKVAAK